MNLREAIAALEAISARIDADANPKEKGAIHNALFYLRCLTLYADDNGL